MIPPPTLRRPMVECGVEVVELAAEELAGVETLEMAEVGRL